MTAAAVAAPLALKAVNYDRNANVGPSGDSTETTVPESPVSRELPLLPEPSLDGRGNIGPAESTTTTESVIGSIGTPSSVDATESTTTSPSTTTTQAAPSTTTSSASSTSAPSTTTSTTAATTTSTTVGTTTSSMSSTSSTSSTATSSSLPTTTQPAAG